MKKVLFSILAIAAFAFAGNAQSVIDAEEGRNPNDFYQQGIVVGKKAMPYPFLRESDVVWKTTIWRQIDFNESFNQFFYFPFETEKNTQGRVNLVNLIVNAAANGEFDVYENDDMKVPQEWEKHMHSCRENSCAPAREKKMKLVISKNLSILFPKTLTQHQRRWSNSKSIGTLTNKILARKYVL